uniref:Uncharacterized protein n=1 Tax=Arundo donax TaxID=35708 RepID=A0A0A8Y282_ARUDO
MKKSVLDIHLRYSPRTNRSYRSYEQQEQRSPRSHGHKTAENPVQQDMLYISQWNHQL